MRKAPIAAVRTARASLLAAAIALPSLARAAPIPESGMWLPRDVSIDGWRIDSLLKSTSVFVLLLFVIMVAWMLLAVFKFNERHQAQYDHGNSRNSVAIALSISAVIFFIVDGNLF
jgi:heme/copper-type cytochrome/quinol oxidase subunit 2